MSAAHRLALALATVMSLPLIGLACQHGEEVSPSSPAADSLTDAELVEVRDADPSDVKSNGVQLGVADLGGGGILLIDGAVIGNQRVTDVAIEQSRFVGVIDGTVAPVTVEGIDFLGAHIQLTKVSAETGGGEITSQVDATIAHIIDIGGGVFAHDIQIFDPATNNYAPACPSSGLAIVLQGSWDEDSGDALGGEANELTFACMDGALSKCTEWGYHGWASPEMAQMHQACTRMVRADFCGDGTANTYNGTKIDVYDQQGIEVQATSWPLEAEWGPDGAVCLGEAQRIAGDEPHCFDDIPVRSNCGKLSAKDGLLASRYRPL